MNKKLMNKFTLKILSLFIAILIWFLVVNIQNPIVTESYYDIPVRIVNESYLASKFEIPLLVDGKDTVNVRIRAKNSIVNKLKREDVTAVADMTQIVSMETEPYMVPVKVTCPGVSEDDITVSPSNIPIDTDKLVSAEKTIAVNYGETTPDKNYEVGEVEVSPNKVTITGPSALINKIDKVVAKIDVTGMTQSAIVPGEISIYDKNQDEISEKEMSYLDLKDISDKKVNVRVDLWKVRQDIVIQAACSGNPEYGYEVNSVNPVPDTISVAGTDEALEKLAAQGNVVEIPGNMIDVSGKSKDFEETIDITEFLPENTKLARDINSSVVVTVKILPYNSKEYDISTTEIDKSSKPENMSVVINQEKVSVRIKGKAEDLNKLEEKDIKLKIDVKNYKEGEYEVPVSVSLPEGYELVDSVSVKVKLASEEPQQTE